MKWPLAETLHTQDALSAVVLGRWGVPCWSRARGTAAGAQLPRRTRCGQTERAARPDGRARLSSSSPPLASSMTRYTLSLVTYASCILMIWGCRTCGAAPLRVSTGTAAGTHREACRCFSAACTWHSRSISLRRWPLASPSCCVSRICTVARQSALQAPDWWGWTSRCRSGYLDSHCPALAAVKGRPDHREACTGSTSSARSAAGVYGAGHWRTPCACTLRASKERAGPSPPLPSSLPILKRDRNSALPPAAIEPEPCHYGAGLLQAELRPWRGSRPASWGSASGATVELQPRHARRLRHDQVAAPRRSSTDDLHGRSWPLMARRIVAAAGKSRSGHPRQPARECTSCRAPARVRLRLATALRRAASAVLRPARLPCNR